MADGTGEAGSGSETHLTFNIKSSGDQKHVVTVPETMTVLELKQKLSTAEYADAPPERQRLIYSGRVLKDPDQLSAYKIKDGNTVHMVKSAASNQRQNPASQGSSATEVGSSTPAGIPGVPQNFATGTGTDPLAGLTGARYAGFAQMPGAETFGPDGMGPAGGPEELLRMLENPMFQSQMNEAMNNPHVIQMIQNHPMMRNNPMLRQMIENPEMRRLMMDPNMIRQSIAMQRALGGGMPGGRGGSDMPAPGVTDTTPQDPNPNQRNDVTNPFMMNPSMAMDAGGFGGMGMPPFTGTAGANPFAALFGGGPNPLAATAPTTNPTSPPPASSATTDATTENSSPASYPDAQRNQTSSPQSPQQQSQQPLQTEQPPNPFAALFGGPQGQGAQPNPFAATAQQMMQNPQMMQAAMQMMGGMNRGGMDQGHGQGQAGEGHGPALDPFMAAMLGGGGGMGSPPPQQQQQDTRPPEEQYAEQLRQLNEMGFYEFERNVRALRMAGGNVQGAVELLLSGI